MGDPVELRLQDVGCCADKSVDVMDAMKRSILLAWTHHDAKSRRTCPEIQISSRRVSFLARKALANE